MNDRFLFRGKKIDGGEWRVGNLLEVCTKDEITYWISVNDTSSGIFRIEINPATICQCTGLRDKHGKLIFEGDIICVAGLRYLICFGNYHDAYISDYLATNGIDRKRAAYGYYAKCIGGADCILSNRIEQTSEVIGNIHDHTELLQEASL